MNVSLWKQAAPCCLANCFADACEVYAAGRIPAALYNVLLRFNLLCTAMFGYFILGKRQAPTQLIMLVGLTMLVFCYAQVPDIVPLHTVWDGFGEPKDPSSTVVTSDLSMFGLVCVVGKLVGCVLFGVLGEKVLKGPHLANESLTVVQGIMFVVCSLVFTPFALFMAYGSDWQHGLFGGSKVSFRHCSTNWTIEECARAVAWTVPQGWDLRTLGVVACYLGREFVVNVVLREFSAMVKELASAGSVAATYFVSGVLSRQKLQCDEVLLDRRDCAEHCTLCHNALPRRSADVRTST
eukprot:TRINITY_DN876_c0_g1_i1.p1 TRINITY_DN876_c0_g1~~TRINITY_DN876_c0_g1_i1.p1  ORF type:complete len:295 (+),score=17.40 TRINITY_DN876_c0_g1_i1:470-1354(+)